jgi:Zn-finger nucleic acid-binding protein
MSAARLACPRCAAPLDPWDAAPVHLCAACGGVFVARTDEDCVLDELDAAARTAITRSAELAQTPTDEAPEVRCPVCAAAMARAPVQRGAGSNGLPMKRLVIDMCSDHGIWLDRGELSSLAYRLLCERGPASRPSGRIGSTPDTGGAIDFLIGALTWL